MNPQQADLQTRILNPKTINPQTGSESPPNMNEEPQRPRRLQKVINKSLEKCKVQDFGAYSWGFSVLIYDLGLLSLKSLKPTYQSLQPLTPRPPKPEAQESLKNLHVLKLRFSLEVGSREQAVATWLLLGSMSKPMASPVKGFGL